MLREVIVEFLASLVADGLSERANDRARALLSLAFGSVALALETYAWVSVDDVLRGPDWAFKLMLSGMCIGLVTAIGSTANLRTSERPMPLVVAAFIGVAAFLWPVSLSFQ